MDSEIQFFDVLDSCRAMQKLIPLIALVVYVLGAHVLPVAHRVVHVHGSSSAAATNNLHSHSCCGAGCNSADVPSPIALQRSGETRYSQVDLLGTHLCGDRCALCTAYGAVVGIVHYDRVTLGKRVATLPPMEMSYDIRDAWLSTPRPRGPPSANAKLLFLV